MKYSEVLRRLKRAGWYKVRQEGSHIIMAHGEKDHVIIVPNHGSKEMGHGLQKKIFKEAGLK